MSYETFELAVVYKDSKKRYIVPFSLLEGLVDNETTDKIKIAALKEINKQ